MRILDNKAEKMAAYVDELSSLLYKEQRLIDTYEARVAEL